MKKSNNLGGKSPIEWRKPRRLGYHQTLSQSQRNEFGRILEHAVILYRCRDRASALAYLNYMRSWLQDYCRGQDFPTSAELLNSLLSQRLDHPLFRERQS